MPARTSLGPDFARVWTASAVSNIGDGVTMIAGPLLVAQLTGDPGLVAGAAFVHQMPWLESPDLTDAIQAAVADNQGIYSRPAVPLK